MNLSELDSIAAEKFGLSPTAPSRLISNGNINQTGVVFTDSGSFVLQEVNIKIFSKPEKLMANVETIIAAVTKANLPTLDLVRCVDGGPLAVCGMTLWRCYRYIDGVTTPNIMSVEQAQSTARSFGRYARALDGVELAEHIVGYHDFDARVDAFEQAVAKDPLGRGATCQQALEDLMAIVDRVRVTPAYAAWREQPVRNAHNDAKGPNCIIGATGRTIIDLDTTMPGTVLSDIGELVRSSTRHLGDVGPEALMAQVASVNRGFLAGYGHTLEPAETKAMLLAGPLLTAENAVRFMGDYLLGDIYYGADTPEQNHDRAVAQLRLAERLVEAIELATSGGLSAA